MSAETVTPTEAELTREDLIALCERGSVQQDHWNDRDSASAQRQLGECLALLRAGCDFIVETAERPSRTHWVRTAYRGFNSFEWGEGHEDDELFYVPSAQRLDRADGQDWY